MIRSRFTNTEEFWLLASLVLGMVTRSVSFLVASGVFGVLGSLLGSQLPRLSLYVAPGVLGYLRPDRPWRWALGLLLGDRLVLILANLDQWEYLAWIMIWGSFLAAPMVAVAHLGAFLSRRKRVRKGATCETAQEQPATSSSAAMPVSGAAATFDRFARTFVWALVWGSVLGGVFSVVYLLGISLMSPGSNLAGFVVFVFGPFVFCIGLLAGALVSLSRRLTDRQMALILARVALVFAVVLLVFMAARDTGIR